MTMGEKSFLRREQLYYYGAITILPPRACRATATVKYNTVHTYIHTHRILLSIGAVYNLTRDSRELLPIPDI